MTESFSLKSSFILGGTYDDETQELTLEFASGGNYSYPNVAPEIVQGLRAAPSAGKFFHANINTRV